MSAQDDLLAAFGELPEGVDGDGTAVEEAAAVGEITAAEPIEETESVAEIAAAEEITAAEPVEEAATVELMEEAEAVKVAEPIEDIAAAEEREPIKPAEPVEVAEPIEDIAATGQIEPVEAAEAGSAEPANAPASAAPYLDPAAFFAQLQAEAAPPPKRRWPRLVLRYALALAVVGAVGAGTAYAITLPKRTDVPFLATAKDGRYDFPFLAKPAPPAGEPGAGEDSNKGHVHYGDLRQYLLPPPTGAVRKEDGWESVADFESSLSGDDVTDHWNDAGLRHIAWRGWTAPDGQHTLVELLQFPDADAAYSVYNVLGTADLAKVGKAETATPPEVAIRGFDAETSNVAMHKFDQVTGLPGQVERRVVFQLGDVVAVVTTTAPNGAPDTPTEQVVMLQAEMLR